MSRISDCRINNVRIVKLNLDAVAQADIESGNGIRLQSVESFDKKRKNAKIEDGLQSEFFGTDFSSDYAFKERYRCKCGKYMGKAWEGTICDVCNTPVEYNDIDLTKTGWIILDKYTVMSPIFYAKFKDALGKFEGESVLDKIIEREYDDDNFGVVFTDKEMAALKKHPFIKKGALWLSEHVDEVIDWYAARKPNKAKIFNELRHDREALFTHCIPVYTSLLRTEMPGEKGQKDYKLKINTCYKALIRTVNTINMLTASLTKENQFDINTPTTNWIDILLKSIYSELDKIFQITYSDLTDKNGVITSKVLGGRYNFSARNIIVPSSSSGRLNSDEVECSYVAFMELFRYEIQNLYGKMFDTTPAQTNAAWKKALNRFDPKFYAVIEKMLSDDEYRNRLTIIVNRNPSINYGSFIFTKIVSVKKDYTDKTLTLPVQVLTPMNADFDGDIINVFRIIGDDMARRFNKNLNPRYNLFISRMDGRVNPEVMPLKDCMVGFWAFNNI